MQIKYDKRLFDTFLEIQAGICFPHEQMVLSHPLWEQTSDILDFGCGNGAYLESLMAHSPNKRYTGFDIDPGYARLARKRLKGRADITDTDWHADLNGRRFNGFLFRFVLLHMRSWAEVKNLVRKYGEPGSAIVIIDTDDENTGIDQRYVALREHIDGVKAHAKMDRTAKTRILQFMSENGFVENMVENIEVSPSNTDVCKIADYLEQSVMIANAGYVPEALAVELHAFRSDPKPQITISYFTALLQAPCVH